MFDRVPVPTPFQVGPVNAYVAGRTVVDPGPDSEEAWETLQDALAERDLAPADVERVLVTHPHPDHFGLASRLREAGASVVASRAATPILQDFPARLDYERDFFHDFFVRCGMADSTAGTVTDLPQVFVHYAPSVEVDHAVAAGDTVTVDGHTLTVDDLVGHATGEILFAFEADGQRQALVGDNVLAEISPNPFLQPPPESGADRPRVLPAYNDSLATLREAGFDRFLTGHREPVESPAERIDAILDEHAERTERVADLIVEPTTPVDVMEALFGDLPATEQYMGMSEAVGHLDVLDDAGRARVREVDGELSYERVD
jgi:glyoxylase-like metal-dependent hydrolase (beta-lactamase superfamily II)